MTYPTEPRIAPLPEKEWTEELRPILAADRDEAPRLGEMNIFTTLARHPDLLKNWMRFAGYILVAGKLSFRDRELLILRTGYNCDSPYEWGQHVRIALAGGIEREVIERVPEGPDAPGWDQQERTLLRAADELHSDFRVSDATWAALSERLDEQQLIEVPMLVGQYHLVAFTLNSLAVQPEPGLEPLP